MSVSLDPLDAISSAFAGRYSEPPAVVVRAPGRVNLIGEHTDYSNLPVLPMAIEQCLFVAAGPRKDGVVEAASSHAEGITRIDRVTPRADEAAPWSAYLAGALKELADIAPGRGANLLIEGELPAGGGLSSSSALTTGLIAALAAAWDAPLAAGEVVRRAIVAERHTGVETGGMDQAVIVFGEAGSALRIDFDPPGHHPVPLPRGLAFVAAYSGADAPKAGDARAAYNERVVGAHLTAAMLADSVGLDLSYPITLRQVAGIDVVEVLVDGLPERISATEVAHGADVDVEHFVRLTAGRFDHQVKVPVRRVARHILSEAGRVDEAEAALRSGDLAAFGRLLNQSHASLRDDFRCSTAALDKVCAAMRKAGAIGARLTGAGFGGYALAATRPEQLSAVIEAAEAATGGPAFEVRAADGLRLL